MVSASVAARLADELGPAIDDVRVQNALDEAGFTDDQALDLLNRVQTGSLRERFVSSLGRTPERVGEVFADQPSRVADVSTSAAGRTLTRLGAIGGATAVGVTAGPEAFEALQQHQRTQQAQSAEEALTAVLTDPHLSDQQRARLLESMREGGLLDVSSDGGGGGGFLPEGIGLTETIIILVALWFIGKALVEAAGSAGGS